MRANSAAILPRSLLVPLAAAAAVRLLLLGAALTLSGTSVIASGDTPSYLEPGRNLLLHGGFMTGAQPEIGRTPGYPLFLALISLAGPALAALVQVLLSALIVLLVWRLARALCRDERVAWLAAWLFAFEPVSVIFSVRLLPETLFLALLLAGLERVALFLRERNLWRLMQAGLWLAAATFVRPISYYLPIALALGLIGTLARDKKLRWQAPAIFLLSVLPWLGAWQLRNQIETGFGGFSSIVVRNLYFYQAAEIEARVEQRPFTEVQSSLGYPDEQSHHAHHPEQAGWNQAHRIAFMRAEAGRVLRAHPVTAFVVQAEGSAVVAFTPCATELLRLLNAYPEDGPQRVVSRGPLRSAVGLAQAHPALAAVMAALEAVLAGLYLLAVRGVIGGGLRRDGLALLLTVALYFLAVSGGAQAVGRYRLPVMPVVCILAAAGWRREKA